MTEHKNIAGTVGARQGASSNSKADAQAALLPPLRVNGVDYRISERMKAMLSAGLRDEATAIARFPTITAAREGSSDVQNEAKVHPAYLTENPGEFHRPPGRRTGSSASGQAGHLPHAANTLVHLFTIAAAQAGGKGFITPAQLLAAAQISVNSDTGETVVTPPDKRDGYLRIALNRENRQEKELIAAVLQVLRGLFYESILNSTSCPVRQIAINGRLEAEIPAPIPYTEDDLPLDLGCTVPERLRYVPVHLPPHEIILGATGSGKTMSAIVPRIRCHLSYTLRDGTKTAALLVDPKKELKALALEHLNSIGEAHRVFIPGKHGRLRLFSASTALSLYDRVVVMMKMCGLNANDGRDGVAWRQKSVAMLVSLVKCHAITYNYYGRDLFNDLLKEAGVEGLSSSGYWLKVRNVLRLLQDGLEGLKWFNERLMARASCSGMTVQERSEFGFLSRYLQMDDDAANQVSYVTGGLEAVLGKLSDENLAKWIDMSPVPELCDENDDTFDVKTLLNQSRVIIIQPAGTPSHDAAMTMLKSQFYRAAMERDNLYQPVLFLCDEFQRYVTGDQESGEAALLDRCRAFRITAVLATQSVTSLYDALAKRDGADGTSYAVDTILANVGRAIFFQTNDKPTTDQLMNSIPDTGASSEWPHPVSVLPLSGLRVGEAYYVAPQGNWGRAQYQRAA